MDRYVEKDVAAAPKEGAQGTKQATSVGWVTVKENFRYLNQQQMATL